MAAAGMKTAWRCWAESGQSQGAARDKLGGVRVEVPGLPWLPVRTSWDTVTGW
jgi:hypothetical protein